LRAITPARPANNAQRADREHQPDRGAGVNGGHDHEAVETSTSEQVLMDHIMAQYESLITQRHLRLFEAHAGVHPLLWLLLAGGAVVTIGFTYFFGIENAWAHGAMIAALTFVIAATLFVIVQVNHPFAGAVSVSTEAMQQVLETFTDS
jgi:hypothetical protein